MKDIYEKTYLIFGQKPPTALLLTWWLAWIATSLFDNFSISSEDPDVLLTSHMVAIPSVFLVLWVIFTLTRRQYEIVTDTELAAKIGTVNPYNRIFPPVPGVPMHKPQLPSTEAAPTNTLPE